MKLKGLQMNLVIKSLRKRLLLALAVFLIASLVVSISPQRVEAQPIVVGNIVSISTSNGDIMVTPHTLTASGWVEVQFKSRSFAGDVDVVLGFNGVDQVQTIKTESWEVYPHIKTKYIEEVVTETFTPKKIISNKQNQKGIKQATLGDDNLNASSADVTYEIDNPMMGGTSTVEATIAYDSFNGKTFTYKVKKQVPEQYTEDILGWKPIADKANNLTDTQFSKNGANKWQTADYSQLVSKDIWYKARFWVEIPITYKDNPIKGKYNVLVKPSGISVQDALTSNNCILLDPWYNSSWLYRKSLTIAGTADGVQANYQMNRTLLFTGNTCNVTHLGLEDNCNADFSDIRFTNADNSTELHYWIESSTAGVSAAVWVEVDTIPIAPGTVNIYIYYGNAGAVAPDTSFNMGSATFLLFDDFSIDLSKWTTVGGIPSIAGGRLLLDSADEAVRSNSTYGTCAMSFLMQVPATNKTCAGGMMEAPGWNTNNDGIWIQPNSDGQVYTSTFNDSALEQQVWGAASYDTNNNKYDILFISATSTKFYYNGTLKTTHTTQKPDEAMYVWFDNHDFATMYVDNVYVRNYTTNEPTWGACGAEENPPPTVSTVAADTITDITANLKGTVDNLNGGGDCTIVGFGWDVHTHATYNAYANDLHAHGAYGVGAFNNNTGVFPAGTIIYYMAYGTNPMGTGQGAEMTFLTKPAAPTNVAATDGWTDNVTVTWTVSTGASGYYVYRGGVDISGLLGIVTTYGDTTAAQGTIDAGIATACDGCSTAFVTLSIAGEHPHDGTTYTYVVVAHNATGNSTTAEFGTNHDTGYRGIGAITYQWYRSAGITDDTFGAIGGAATDPYNDTTGVVSPFVRWYLCAESAAGAVSDNSTHDSGYMAGNPSVSTKAVSGFDKVSATANGEVTVVGAGATSIIERGFDYSLTNTWILGSYLSNTEIGVFGIGNFSLLLTGLDPATLYYCRAKAKNNVSGWIYGSDTTFSTKGALTLYEEHSVSCNTTPTTPDIYGNNVVFQTFTTDNVSIAHTVSTVKIYARRVNGVGTDPGVATISIRNAPAGTPSGADITSATVDSLLFSTTFSWFSADMDSEIGLESDKMYAIVVVAPSGDVANYLQWSMSNTDNYTGGTGGYSADSGATWTSDANRDYCFQVWGNPTAEMLDAKVFSSYLETGDWLITCLYYNTYPPYYDNGDDISLYFYLQLVDGNIVKAQTKVSAWGFKPGSIYLSPEMVESLEWGKAYKVRMFGNFGTYPYIDYTLRPVDWLGSDMNKLAAWCRVTSGKIESFYGDTLTTYVTGKGQVLNAQGGSIFVEGIPELDKVLPNLFETATGALSGVVVESTGAYQRELQWEEMWGPTVTRNFTLWGNVLSVSGSTIGAIFFFLAYILAGALTFPTGHTMVGIGISFPLILVAFFTGLIPLVLAGVLLGVSTILLVREFIWKGG